MNINYFVRPESGSSFHRLVNPMDYIDWGEGNSCKMLWYRTEESMIDCDVLIYGHYMETDAQWLAQLKHSGTKIVVDVDDYWEIPDWFYRKKMLEGYKHTERVIANLKIADLVICTTMRLQEKVRQYNKNTVVIPNALQYDREEYGANTRILDEKMRFIHVGGSSHYEDLQSIGGKLKRIGSDSQLKKEAKFIVAGYRAHAAKRYHTWHDQQAQNDNYEIVKANGVWDKIISLVSNTGTCEVLPSLHPNEYIKHYDHGDVSIVPLQDKEWNYYKSTLKFAEAATRNIPVMCSKVAPYSDLEDIKGVIWVENNDWYKGVKKCVKEPNYVKDMGLQLGEYCREHFDLVKWSEVRKQVIQSLI